MVDKKARLYNSRTIRTQQSDPSFDHETLNIPEFLNSRAFEIRSFELSQLNTKYASSNRVFQSLPRTLRRRAASHNVKRVPKRMRQRALREMQNVDVPKPHRMKRRDLYRLRMAKKLLRLGVRLKLQRQLPGPAVLNKNLNIRKRIASIDQQLKTDPPKLNNINGSHDHTGVNELASLPKGGIKYFKRQRRFVWMPSHIWHAKRFHMIKEFGYQIPLSPTQKCFRAMNRAKEQSVLFDTSYNGTLVVDAGERVPEVLRKLTKFKGNIPVTIIDGKRSYDDWIYVDDKKVGKGLVFVCQGKILIRVFPSIFESVFNYLKSETVYDCRYSIANFEVVGKTALSTFAKVLYLTNVNGNKELLNIWSALSRIADTSLIPTGTTFGFYADDPRFWKHNHLPKAPPFDIDLILQLHSTTLTEPGALADLLDGQQREKSYMNQYSLKQLNGGFSRENPNSNVLSHESFKIPLMLTKSKSGWVLFMPWFWAMPFWTSFIKDQKLKVGGLRQMRQFNFEKLLPSFPTDYHFLKDGWYANEANGILKSQKYQRKPKSMRQPFTENGIDPFKCDWTFLQTIVFGSKLPLKTENTYSDYNDDGSRNIHSINDLVQLAKNKDSSNVAIELFDPNNEFHQTFVRRQYDINVITDVPVLPVLQVSLKITGSGSIQDNARLYTRSGHQNSDPSVLDLIGFVTSGSFNLDLGRPTGIGLVRADVRESVVLVRNPGATSVHQCEVNFL